MQYRYPSNHTGRRIGNYDISKYEFIFLKNDIYIYIYVCVYVCSTKYIQFKDKTKRRLNMAEYLTKLSQILPGNRIRCLICNNFCIVNPTERGMCQTKKNIEGVLTSLVYGYPTSISVDPIEKKPLYHFQPKTKTLSIGTLGCNFQCKNCQNHSISQPNEEIWRNINYVSGGDIHEWCTKSNIKSISFTYNEPTVFIEYALDIMNMNNTNSPASSKIENIWISNGYMSSHSLNLLIPKISAVNIDLKSMEDKFYTDICGVERKNGARVVMDNILALKEAGVHVEITTLIIPGLSSDLSMLRNMANFIANQVGVDTPWHISRFSSPISWKLHSYHDTSLNLLMHIWTLGRECGLRNVYIGNIQDWKTNSTYCKGCGEVVVWRLGYEVDIRYTHEGRCRHCGDLVDIVI